MKAVVTGGAGFIGSHLVDALVGRGDEVTVVDDLSGPGSLWNIEHHSGLAVQRIDVATWALDADLTDVDVVFHLACTSLPVSMRDPELDLRTNALGTLRLLEAVARAGVRKYVHASSGSVFGEPLAGRQDEDHLTRPASFYGVSKLAGESYVRVMADLHGIDFAALRYYKVVGPRQAAGDDGGVVPIFIRRALAREPLIVHGTGEQVRSFTSVHDVVAATLLAADHPAARGFYNVGSARTATIGELATFVSDVVGGVPILHAPARPGDVFELRVDAERIRALGATFDIDWRDAVREVIESCAVAA